jgi:ferritin-like protein
MRNFSAKWVSKCLDADQKLSPFQPSEEILEISLCDPNDFPSRWVTLDETLLFTMTREKAAIKVVAT